MDFSKVSAPLWTESYLVLYEIAYLVLYITQVKQYVLSLDKTWESDYFNLDQSSFNHQNKVKYIPTFLHFMAKTFLVV